MSGAEMSLTAQVRPIGLVARYSEYLAAQMNPNNLTELNPNLDPRDPTQPKIGFKFGSFGFIRYIIGCNPNLNPT